MSDTSVVSKIKDLRKDLDRETNFLQQQMELPLNGQIARNDQSENNSKCAVSQLTDDIIAKIIC